jgi:short-subunit dehydrogenase
MRIEGSRAIVTGASSGIGRWIAAALVEEGGAVVLAARDRAMLERIADRLRWSFPDAPAPLVVPCDVSRQESVHRLVRTAARRMGGLDLLVNNAGISVYGPTLETTPTDLRTLLDVNLFGPLYAMLESVPILQRTGGGMIANVGSVAGLHGVPYLGAYGASKAALAALGQSLRAELADGGIHVLNVYPGYTRTRIFDREKRLGGARRPAGRYAPPDRVARAIVHAIHKEKTELVLSPSGRILALVRTSPRLTDRAMARLAGHLKDADSRRYGRAA